MEASPLQVWCCKNNGQATRIDVLGADPNVDDLKKAAIPNLAPAEYSQVTITTCDDKVLDPRDELHPLMAKGHGVNKGKDLKVLYAMPSAAEPQAKRPKMDEQMMEAITALQDGPRQLQQQQQELLRQSHVFSNTIVVQADLPAEHAPGEQCDAKSILASDVGKPDRTTLSNWVCQHVVGHVLDWDFKVPAEGTPQKVNNLGQLQTLIHKTSTLGFKIVESPQKYTLHAKIQDRRGMTTLVKARVDALVLSSPSFVKDTDVALTDLMQQVVLFVEVESSNKGGWSEVQLRLALMVIAASMNKGLVVGVWIDSSFSQAKLMRFRQGIHEADGTFDPALLPEVAMQLWSGPQ